MILPSKEWVENYAKAINESKEYEAAAKGWGIGYNGDFVFQIDEAPVEKVDQMPEGDKKKAVKDFFKEYLKGKTLYIFMALKDGKCTGARFVKEPSEVEAGFALSAKYEVWKELLSGKSDPMKAIMQGKMKLAGDMMKVMKYTKGAILLGQLTAKVPVEFFDEVK